ncbi:MAG TPA: SRPBCC family protein [Candidatus Eisenbacteria bacterium]|nr:SRPBCC family protein [Candidatus Eisenbacteria bacterium]
MNPAPNVVKVAPIRKSVVVRRTPAEAFSIFTERITSWWPHKTHSLSKGEAASVHMEPKAGGKVYELSTDGERKEWGTLVSWDPPRGFVTTWHPGMDPAHPSEVEIRFTAVPEGTRVDLEHRNWEKVGAKAAEYRDGYDKGWVEVFERRFVEACAVGA